MEDRTPIDYNKSTIEVYVDFLNLYHKRSSTWRSNSWRNHVVMNLARAMRLGTHRFGALEKFVNATFKKSLQGQEHISLLGFDSLADRTSADSSVDIGANSHGTERWWYKLGSKTFYLDCDGTENPYYTQDGKERKFYVSSAQ